MIMIFTTPFKEDLKLFQSNPNLYPIKNIVYNSCLLFSLVNKLLVGQLII